eukprot:11157552-Lingulodinium_polyedra.AAC.1
MTRCSNSRETAPIGESIRSHVTSVNPKQVAQHALAQELAEVLDMSQKRLLCGLFDEICSDCNKR